MAKFASKEDYKRICKQNNTHSSIKDARNCNKTFHKTKHCSGRHAHKDEDSNKLHESSRLDEERLVDESAVNESPHIVIQEEKDSEILEREKNMTVEVEERFDIDSFRMWISVKNIERLSKRWRLNKERNFLKDSFIDQKKSLLCIADAPYLLFVSMKKSEFEAELERLHIYYSSNPSEYTIASKERWITSTIITQILSSKQIQFARILGADLKETNYRYITDVCENKFPYSFDLALTIPCEDEYVELINHERYQRVLSHGNAFHLLGVEGYGTIQSKTEKIYNTLAHHLKNRTKMEWKTGKLVTKKVLKDKLTAIKRLVTSLESSKFQTKVRIEITFQTEGEDVESLLKITKNRLIHLKNMFMNLRKDNILIKKEDYFSQIRQHFANIERECEEKKHTNETRRLQLLRLYNYCGWADSWTNTLFVKKDANIEDSSFSLVLEEASNTHKILRQNAEVEENSLSKEEQWEQEEQEEQFHQNFERENVTHLEKSISESPIELIEEENELNEEEESSISNGYSEVSPEHYASNFIKTGIYSKKPENIEYLNLRQTFPCLKAIIFDKLIPMVSLSTARSEMKYWNKETATWYDSSIKNSYYIDPHEKITEEIKKMVLEQNLFKKSLSLDNIMSSKVFRYTVYKSSRINSIKKVNKIFWAQKNCNFEFTSGKHQHTWLILIDISDSIYYKYSNLPKDLKKRNKTISQKAYKQRFISVEEWNLVIENEQKTRKQLEEMKKMNEANLILCQKAVEFALLKYKYEKNDVDLASHIEKHFDFSRFVEKLCFLSKGNIKERVEMTQRMMIEQDEHQEKFRRELLNILSNPSENEKAFVNPFLVTLQFNGLENRGQECYANAVLQCLFNIRFIYESIIALDNEITKLLSTINNNRKRHQEIAQQNAKDEIYRLISAESNTKFTYKRPNDAQEFLHILLDHIYKSSDKNIENIFQATYIEEVKCTSCFAEFNQDVIEEVLQISFEDQNYEDLENVNLRSLLKKHFDVEIIQDYRCEACKQKKSCEKTFKILVYPKMLIVHLKLFEFDGNTRKKKVLFESYKEVETISFFDKMFSLQGIILHRGDTLQTGHYTSCCRSPEGHDWVYFNDRNVRELKELDLLKSQGNPYILFFASQ